MTLTSVWIGYGNIVDPALWSTGFEEWFQYEALRARGIAAPLHMDKNVVMIPLATTTKVHAEFLGIVELPYDSVFAFDEVTRCIPPERITVAHQQWEQFRGEAWNAGFRFSMGTLLFAHLCD